MIDDEAIREQLQSQYEWDNYNAELTKIPRRKKCEDDITDRSCYDLRSDDAIEEDEDNDL